MKIFFFALPRFEREIISQIGIIYQQQLGSERKEFFQNLFDATLTFVGKDKNTQDARIRAEIYTNLLKSIILAQKTFQDTETIIYVRNKIDIIDLLYEPESGLSDKNAMQLFKCLDFIFAEGDLNVPPWNPIFKRAHTLLKMCIQSQKRVFLSGGLANCIIYLSSNRIASNSPYIHCGKNASEVLKNIKQDMKLGVSDYIVESTSGDAYQVVENEKSENPASPKDKQKNYIIKECGNVGIHKENHAEDDKLIGKYVIKTEVYRDEQQFGQKLEIKRLNEEVVYFNKKYAQHFLLQGMHLQILVNNGNRKWNVHSYAIDNQQFSYIILGDSKKSKTSSIQLINNRSAVAVFFYIENLYPQSVQLITNYFNHYLPMIAGSNEEIDHSFSPNKINSQRKVSQHSPLNMNKYQQISVISNKEQSITKEFQQQSILKLTEFFSASTQKSVNNSNHIPSYDRLYQSIEDLPNNSEKIPIRNGYNSSAQLSPEIMQRFPSPNQYSPVLQNTISSQNNHTKQIIPLRLLNTEITSTNINATSSAQILNQIANPSFIRVNPHSNKIKKITMHPLREIKKIPPYQTRRTDFERQDTEGVVDYQEFKTETNTARKIVSHKINFSNSFYIKPTSIKSVKDNSLNDISDHSPERIFQHDAILPYSAFNAQYGKPDTEMIDATQLKGIGAGKDSMGKAARSVRQISMVLGKKTFNKKYLTSDEMVLPQQFQEFKGKLAPRIVSRNLPTVMVRIKVDDGNQEDCGKKKLYHFESEREISSKKFNFNSNVVKNIEGGNTFSPLKLESRKK